MMLDVRGTLLGNSSSGRFNPLKKRASYLLGINRNGRKATVEAMAEINSFSETWNRITNLKTSRQS